MTKLKTLAVAAATLAATATLAPMSAQAGDYRKCKDTEATVAGGLIGGSLGTIIGEEIAGRGNKTEGAILGGIIGGIAGAAVGDSASSCEKDGRIYTRHTDGRFYPRAHTTNYRTVSHPHHGSQYRNNGYRNHHYDNRGYDRRHYDNGYQQWERQRNRRLRRIDRRIDDLRRERRDLKQRARYEGYRPWIDRRLSNIAYDLDRLKRDRKRIKRQEFRRNDYRRAYSHHRGY